jgi:hypothetical protein
MKKNLFIFTLISAVSFVGCINRTTTTYIPHAYANIKTWDVGFLLVTADIKEIKEVTTDSATGKATTITSTNGQTPSTWSVRDDIYYHMKGKGGYKMAPTGVVADATVKISFDAFYPNGNFSVINLTVFNKSGEAISRLKIENNEPIMNLKNRTKIIEDIVKVLTDEVMDNR